jgi:predicted ATP-grasp superfamily ATP-dependent carboligase
VIAADSERDSLGFHSRFASEKLVYPSPESSPNEFIEEILDFVQKHPIGLVIPVTDGAILPLSEHRNRFSGLCEFAIPKIDALQVVTNKLQTLQLAAKVGVPTPSTCLVHTAEEAFEEGKSLGFPMVLKPIRSRLYHSEAGTQAFTVSYATDEATLIEQMRRFEGKCPVLLQEYYPGSGQGVELLLENGRPLAAFQHKRLREIPVHGGASAFRESVPVDPVLYRYSVDLLAAIQWTGLAMVEFKIGEAGPKLMEINGRVWGSIPLAILSGMDFPAMLADLYLSRKTQEDQPVDTNYRIGVRARNLDLEIVWILAVLRGKNRYPFIQYPNRWQAIRAIGQLFHPAYKFDVQSWQDPGPGLVELPKIARKLGRKIRENT